MNLDFTLTYQNELIINNEVFTIFKYKSILESRWLATHRIGFHNKQWYFIFNNGIECYEIPSTLQYLFNLKVREMKMERICGTH